MPACSHIPEPRIVLMSGLRHTQLRSLEARLCPLNPAQTAKHPRVGAQSDHRPKRPMRSEPHVEPSAPPPLCEQLLSMTSQVLLPW